jgi:hypothetical protein
MKFTHRNFVWFKSVYLFSHVSYYPRGYVFSDVSSEITSSVFEEYIEAKRFN